MIFAVACDKVPLLAPTQSTITLSVNSTTVGVNGTVQVIATVVEQAGTPVQNGTLVTFTGSLGSFDPVDAETTNGKATTIFRSNGESGTAKIGAVSGGAKATEVDLKIGGAAADQVVVRAEPGTVPVTGGTTQIVASVIDVNGNPLVGAPVVFSADNGVLSPNSAVTNSAGEARTSLETTRTTIVRAAVGAKFATVTVTAVPLPTISIALASSGGIGAGQPEVGSPVSFTVTPGTPSGSGTAPPPGNPIRNVIVDYGDGQTDNLGGITATTTISHTYARPGTYRVTATVTDIQGLTNNASLVINVSERSPITVTLNASPNPVTLGGLQQGLVQFTANATTSGTGTTGLTYFWDFGDGASAITSGGTTNHRYSATGTYVTRLTVRSATGQEGFGEVTVRVVSTP
jgi:hypothetical protein